MFDNIAKLRFIQGHNGEPAANAMISAEGEIMEFRSPVVAEGKVEDWMTEVLGEMRRTNRLITKESIFRYLDGMTRSVVLASGVHLAPDYRTPRLLSIDLYCAGQ